MYYKRLYTFVRFTGPAKPTLLARKGFYYPDDTTSEEVVCGYCNGRVPVFGSATEIKRAHDVRYPDCTEGSIDLQPRVHEGTCIPTDVTGAAPYSLSNGSHQEDMSCQSDQEPGHVNCGVSINSR